MITRKIVPELRDIYDVKLRNRQMGCHFFDADSMRFFRSRTSQTALRVLDRYYFTTSEQFTLADYTARRAYTVRYMDIPTGRIDEIGEFQQYASNSGATAAMQRAAQAYADELNAQATA